MESDDTSPDEDAFFTLLAEWDDALATGGPLPDAPEQSSSQRGRLNRDLSMLHLLREALPAEAPALPEATRFGRFLLRRELGRGGFGIVYLADDPQRGGPVALKVPRVEGLTDPELRGRFLREARAAASLDHPNVVALYEVGEVGPVCYIASAYCPGPNLAVWLKRQQSLTPPRVAATLIAALADAMSQAHDRGVLHRDLKPSNILLDVERADGPFPLITDFGLAKLVEADDHNTASGAIVGTPAYMAPEQALGQPNQVGPPADIYALGAILYEILTDRPPFKGPTMLSTLEQVRSHEPLPPNKLHAELPRDLQTICVQCLAKEPGDRYPSAAALRDDLRRFLAGEAIHARPPSIWSRMAIWSKQPERIPQAGLVMFTHGVVFLCYSAIIILIVLTGVIVVVDWWFFAIYAAIFVLGFHVPMAWLGWRTLHRKTATLWCAAMLSLLYAFVLLFGTLTHAPMGMGETHNVTYVLVNALMTAVAATVFLFQLVALRAARAMRR